MNAFQTQLLSELDQTYEIDCLAKLSVKDICTKHGIAAQRLEVEIAPFLAELWIDASDPYRLRLTEAGKEEFDRQSGNYTNRRIRDRLLAALAQAYEENAHVRADTVELETKLGLDANKVWFNLKIMEGLGLVEFHPYSGAGRLAAHAKLTPGGKTIHDNPEPRIVFLSHAASDKEIVLYLKQVVENTFNNVEVFASTDPEDLPFGDPWVQTILSKLGDAKVVLILGTERGLNRKWVWFEAGAGWSRLGQIWTCCVGKLRKGSVPSPFGIYQALNADEEDDCRVLFQLLENRFEPPLNPPRYSEICSQLIRLDQQVAERE